MNVPSEEPAGYGASFWVGVAIGWAVMGYGVWWTLANARFTRPVDLARWAGLTVLAHDLIFAPVVVLIGWGVSRILPRWSRTPTRVALGLTLVLVLVALPPLTGFGDRPSNPTLNPLAYGANLALLVGAVWTGAAAWALVRYRGRT